MSDATRATRMTGPTGYSGTHTSFENRYQTPGQSGVTTFTRLHARRVDRNGVNEAQIELTVGKFFKDSNRATEQHATVSFSPALARELALALCPEFTVRGATTPAWRFEEKFDTDGETSLGLYVLEGNEEVARLPGIGRHDFERAERIVQCVNLHDELATVLQRVTDHLHELTKDERDDPAVGVVGWDDANQAVAEARATLAKTGASA